MNKLGQKTTPTFLFRDFAFAVVPFVASLGCGSAKGSDLNVVTTAASTDTRLWAIVHGTSDGRLVFVVLEGGPRTEAGQKSSVRSGSALRLSDNRQHTTAELIRPDGTKVKLPSSVQLMEIIDGRYRESSERVTLDEFDAFMKSNPDTYSIEALLRFADSHQKPK